MDATQARQKSEDNKESALLDKLKKEYEDCQKDIQKAIKRGETSTICRRDGFSDSIKVPYFKKPADIIPYHKTIFDYTMLPETVQKLRDQKFKVTEIDETKRRFWDDDDYKGWISTHRLNKVSW